MFDQDTERNPCADIETPACLPPVVTTAEEAIEHLKRGSGVGLDLRGKSPEEIDQIRNKVRAFQLEQLSHRRTATLKTHSE